MKLATDIKNEIEKRGEISIQENYVTGEEFEKWLYEKDNEKHKDRNDIKVRFLLEME